MSERCKVWTLSDGSSITPDMKSNKIASQVSRGLSKKPLNVDPFRPDHLLHPSQFIGVLHEIDIGSSFRLQLRFHVASLLDTIEQKT